jgi:hypothetical protein
MTRGGSKAKLEEKCGSAHPRAIAQVFFCTTFRDAERLSGRSICVYGEIGVAVGFELQTRAQQQHNARYSQD